MITIAPTHLIYIDLAGELYTFGVGLLFYPYQKAMREAQETG